MLVTKTGSIPPSSGDGDLKRIPPFNTIHNGFGEIAQKEKGWILKSISSWVSLHDSKGIIFCLSPQAAFSN